MNLEARIEKVCKRLDCLGDQDIEGGSRITWLLSELHAIDELSKDKKALRITFQQSSDIAWERVFIYGGQYSLLQGLMDHIPRRLPPSETYKLQYLGVRVVANCLACFQISGTSFSYIENLVLRMVSSNTKLAIGVLVVYEGCLQPLRSYSVCSKVVDKLIEQTKLAREVHISLRTKIVRIVNIYYISFPEKIPSRTVHALSLFLISSCRIAHHYKDGGSPKRYIVTVFKAVTSFIQAFPQFDEGCEIFDRKKELENLMRYDSISDT